MSDPVAARLEHIYRKSWVMIQRRALRITRNPSAADDLAQEAFIRLHEQLASGARIDDDVAWLYSTVSHLALNRLRNRQRRARLLERHGPALGEGAHGEALSADALAIQRVLTLVGEDIALVASYYYLDGMEQQEIADLMGLHRRKVGPL